MSARTPTLEREGLTRQRVNGVELLGLEILFPNAVTRSDYAKLGKDFKDSKVMMVRRRGEVTALAAFRLLPEAFYVHTFWFEGANELSYDGEAISLLVFQLRKASTELGYDGIDFQCMDEMSPVFPFLNMHCKAKLVGVFGFIPGMRRKVDYDNAQEGDTIKP